MLKKLLSFIGIGLLMGSYSASAQVQFTFQTDTVKTCSDAGTAPHSYPYQIGDNWDNIEMHNYITNNSSDTIVYKWKVLRDESFLPEGWSWFGFCDNYLCRAPFGPWWETGEEQTSNPLFPGNIAPQQNRDFKALVCAPSDKPNGTAILRVRVAVANGLVDTATFIFSKPCNPLGVHDLLTAADNRVALYPNPATDRLNVFVDKELHATKIHVFNILGSKQMAAPITKEISALDISVLAPGMYVMRIEDKNGKLLTTRKFAKN